MPSPSPAHMRNLKSSLANFHHAHAVTYGQYETCEEDCCVEGKLAIAWLESRQTHTSPTTPIIISKWCSAFPWQPQWRRLCVKHAKSLSRGPTSAL